MKKLVDYCVGCKDMGLPCLGDSCPNRKRYVEFCDECGDIADYLIDERAYCQSCAEAFIAENFNDLSLYEQADILGMSLRQL